MMMTEQKQERQQSLEQAPTAEQRQVAEHQQPSRLLQGWTTKPTGNALFEINGNPADLFKAMAVYRQQVKQPKLDASNPFFKSTYLTLDGLQKAINDGIKKTGLNYMQIAVDNQQLKSVQTVITHESGVMLITQPLTFQTGKMTPQDFGSAITYAKRYQLQALFGISGEVDDDGNRASNRQQPQGQRQAPPLNKPPYPTYQANHQGGNR